MTSAKVTKPIVHDIYQRDGLFKLLDGAVERPLTWVSAPAGSGKTTAVASYLQARGLPCLWYQVDESDADTANFFLYMGIAERRGASKKRRPLPLLTPEYLETIPAFTRNYFEDLYSRLSPPFTIVLDNYQDVPALSRFHEVIRAGLEVVPDGIKTIIISRLAPHKEFSRLRASNKMSRLGWEELRFGLHETRELLHSGKNKQYPDEHISRLQDITDGWVAGIVLLAEDTDLDKVAPLTEGIGSSGVFDYFAAEVFKRVDDETRAFLIKTSFLPQVEPSLAGKLTGVRDARKILTSLNKENFFTTNHRQDSAVYQYHPLFREFLQAQAGLAFSEAEILEVKRRAALLLDEAGRPEDAVELLIGISDWKAAGELVCRYSSGLLAQGRSLTVKSWLDSLPAAVIEDAPYLLYWKGVCYSPVDPMESRRLFEKAFGLFGAQGDRTGMFLAWCGGADLCLHCMEYGHVEKWVASLDDMLRVNGVFPSPEMEAKVTMSMFNALSLRLPDHPDMDTWTEKAFSIMHLRGDVDINLRLLAGIYLVVYSIWMGDFGRAKAVMDFFEDAPSKGISGLVQTTIITAQALYYLMTSSKELCLSKVDEELRVAEKTGVHVWDSHVVMHGMGSALSEQDFKSLEMLFKKLPSDVEHARRMDQGYYHLILCWKALLENDKEVSEHHARLALEFMKVTGFTAGIIICAFSLSEILYENGKKAEAENLLATASEMAHKMRSGLFIYHCYLIKSRLAYDRDDVQEGMDWLRKAMSLAAGKGYVNMCFWRSDVMLSHCMRALEAGIEVDSVKELIRRRGLVPDEPPYHVDGWPWPLKVHTLGRFELERHGEPVRFTGKVQQKPLSMLKALIALGGRDVRVDELMDILWPDADGDTAHAAFKTTLSRLRQLLGVENAIVVTDKTASLDRKNVWVDAWAFRDLLLKANKLWKDKGKASAGDEAVRLAEKAISMYGNHFLPSDAGAPWTVSMREELRDKFLRLVVNTGLSLEKANRWDEAILYYQRALEVDDLTEEFYQRLMECYRNLGRRAEAASLYQRCKKRLDHAFGISPSEETELIYRAILRQGGK